MKLNSIQALRAIAALMVAFYHLRADEMGLGSGQVWGGNVLGFAAGNGYAGVDLFFVISGFIMVYVTGGDGHGVKRAGSFLFARAARIYPLWWLFAGIFTVYMLVTYGLTGLSASGETAIGRGIPPVEYLIKSFALLPQAEHPVLGVGWTLVHEIYFYLVFALTLLAPRAWLPGLLALWAGFVLMGAALGWTGPVADTIIALATYPMTLEFILGAVAGLLVTSGRRFAPMFVTVMAAVWLVAALLLVLPPDFRPGPEAQALGPFALQDGQLALRGQENWGAYILVWGRVVFFGLPAALLVYGVASLEADNRLRTPGWLARLGDWSFALYLSHILVFQGLERILPVVADTAVGLGVPVSVTGFLVPGAAGIQDNLVFIAIAITAAILVSCISYVAFERPLMRLFGRWRALLFRSDAARLSPRPIRSRVW